MVALNTCNPVISMVVLKPQHIMASNSRNTVNMEVD